MLFFSNVFALWTRYKQRKELTFKLNFHDSFRLDRDKVINISCWWENSQLIFRFGMMWCLWIMQNIKLVKRHFLGQSIWYGKLTTLEEQLCKKRSYYWSLRLLLHWYTLFVSLSILSSLQHSLGCCLVFNLDTHPYYSCSNSTATLLPFTVAIGRCNQDTQFLSQQ